MAAGSQRGSKIGIYTVTTTLGHGTFGKVKLAVNDETGLQYAMKILDKADIKTHDLTESVRREISIMKALSHKNIVDLVEVLSSKHKLYIVMGLVRGGELFDLIDKHRGFSENVARRYFQQLVDGVEYCHRNGVCHRDLKPENLLVDENGGLKITDFGVSSMKQNNTLLFTACGTPFYAAPEILQNSGEGYDGHKADVWSCGVILYLLLCGQLPWENEDDMYALYEEIKRAKFAYPPEISDGALDLISNMMQRTPTLRYSLQEVKMHAWFLEGYDSGGRNDVTTEMLEDNYAQKIQPRRSRHKIKIPAPMQFGRRPSKDDRPGPYHADEQNASDAQRRGSELNPEAEAALARVAQRSSPSTSDISSTSKSPSQTHLHPPEIASDHRHAPRRNVDASHQDPSPRLARDVLSRCEGVSITDFLIGGLTGKPTYKIVEIVEKLASIDIDCVEDLQTVAEFLEGSDNFQAWIEERSGMPAVTAMRLSKLFF